MICTDADEEPESWESRRSQFGLETDQESGPLSTVTASVPSHSRWFMFHWSVTLDGTRSTGGGRADGERDGDGAAVADRETDGVGDGDADDETADGLGDRDDGRDGGRREVGASPAKNWRAVRGGGCCSMFGLPRASNRVAFPPDYVDEDLGFRCARDSQATTPSAPDKAPQK